MDGGIRRLSRSARQEREQGFLLASAAVVSLLTSLWLLALPSTWPRLFGLAGLAFSVLFAQRARRAFRSARVAPDSFLELDAAGLRLQEGPQTQLLCWSQIHGVGVDEDRLVVSLCGEGGETLLELEPSYGELGVHDLCDTVTAVWRAARPGGGCNADKRG